MRFVPIAVSICLVWSTGAIAQTADTIRRDIMAALSTPLPITVIGPLIASDVTVTQDGDAFRAELDNPLVMGIVPLGKVSFRIAPQDGGLYRVTDFTLADTIDLFNMATLKIGSVDFDGLWSPEANSYQALTFRLNALSVLPRELAGARVDLGSLALQVAKEGENGAAESSFQLAGTDVRSKGFTADDLAIARVGLDLKADGKEPVDLYAVISRFAILSLMDPDANKLVQFAESLRVRSYDRVSVGLTLDGLDLRSGAGMPDRHLTVSRASGSAEIGEMTPEEWGSVAFVLDAKDLSEKGYGIGASVDIASARNSIDGSRIPIGATLSAVTRLRDMMNGQTVRIAATDLIDGFLNFGALTLSSGVSDMSIVPDNPDGATTRVDRYTSTFGLDGFRDQKGRILFEAALDGLGVGNATFADPMQQRLFQTLAPTSVRYDVSISELNEGLLRRLASDLVVSTQSDLTGLIAPGIVYAMAMNPVIETRDARFVSREIDAHLSANVRFYPAWALISLPYDGQQTMSLSGYDKIVALLDDVERMMPAVDPFGASDRSSIAALRGVMSALRALARDEAGTLAWRFEFPEAGVPLFKVNDTVLRFPDFGALTSMIGLGMGLR